MTVDNILLPPMDLPRPSHRLRPNGHLHHLPRGFQLLGGRVPPVRVLCARSPVLYAKHVRGHIPIVYKSDVHESGLCAGGQSARRDCGAAGDCALGVALQRGADPRAESDREGDYGEYTALNQD